MDDLHEQCVEYFLTLQDQITDAFEALDSTPFREDRWQYHGEGGGRTRILVEGKVFEKAGVNFSQVSGRFPDDLAATMPGNGSDFRASGVSLVLHPWNPMVPTVHANFRHIVKGDSSWFGGGADLTPYYPVVADIVHFHRVWKQVCQRHDKVADHARLKAWCDEYFFIKHRNEPRGVGGIFFDYMQEKPLETFAFVQDAGNAFLESYVPIAERRRHEPYSAAQRDFQLFRRGRYVEFNLVYDRGTVFGLKTGGRIESILMSLPLNVRWLYDYQPPAGSREAELYDTLTPRDWADLPLDAEG